MHNSQQIKELFSQDNDIIAHLSLSDFANDINSPLPEMIIIRNPV
jgi:hypothetical protein